MSRFLVSITFARRSILGLSATMLLLALPPASALVFEVDRMDDATVDACTPGGCTLRDAIAAANDNGGGDTINIPSGRFILDPSQGALIVTDDVTITGVGEGACDDTDTCILGSLVPAPVFGELPVDGEEPSNSPVFVVSSGSAAISGVTVTHGNNDGLSQGGATTFGLAIGGGGPGGGVVVESGASLDLSDCVIEKNYSNLGGGGIANFGTLTVTNCRVKNNVARFAGGGGLFNNGTANIIGSTISGPSLFGDATTSGSPSDLGSQLQAVGFCGGIINFSELTLDQSTVSGYAGLVGGGICNTPAPMEPMGYATLSGAPPAPSPDAILTLTGSTVENNFALLGGGIWNRAGSLALLFLAGSESSTFGTAFLRLQDESEVRFNGALFGGGIMNSRTVIEELLGPHSAVVLGQAVGADPALTGQLLTASATATAPASLTMSNIGPAIAEIVDSAIRQNTAVIGGGILNDQYFLPALVFGVLQGGFLPNLTDPGNVDVLLEDSQLVENAAPVGGGVATFAATANSNGSSFNTNTSVAPFFATGAAITSSPSVFPGAGGGLYNAYGPVGISTTTFDGNSSTLGGGIANVSGDSGLGIPVETVVAIVDFLLASGSASLPTESLRITTLAIDSSTLSNNQGFNSGGGLLQIEGETTAINSTFSGNETAGTGGGIYTVDGHLELSHVTVTNNTAGQAGGVGKDAFSVVRLRSTIVAGNFDENGGENPDCHHRDDTFTSLGSNLVGDDTGCPDVFVQAGDQVGADPKLEALADHGAPTRTHRLLDGSAAINQVVDGCVDAQGAPVADDQRGFARPQGAACDIGAYEGGCGDTVVDEPGEDCDPGDPDPNDCCTDTCQLEPTDTTCRAAGGACDAAEACSGDEASCPADEVVPNGTECRASSGSCDPQELCDGAAKQCPLDVPFLDSDGDSVCDDLEPDTGMDPTVVTLQPPGQEPLITAEIAGGNCNRIVGFEFLQESDLPVEDDDGIYPDGLVDVSVCSDDDDQDDGEPCDGVPPCTNGVIKITFEQSAANYANGFIYRFFDPTTVVYNALPGVDLMGNMATLNLTDDGFGDVSTGVAAQSGAVTSGNVGNGTIRNIGGPAIGDRPAPAPAMSPFALAFAGLWLLGVAATAMRKRQRP